MTFICPSTDLKSAVQFEGHRQTGVVGNDVRGENSASFFCRGNQFVGIPKGL